MIAPSQFGRSSEATEAPELAQKSRQVNPEPQCFGKPSGIAAETCSMSPKKAGAASKSLWKAGQDYFQAICPPKPFGSSRF
mmetsp:Transcript_114298/g.272040  ORF Transcript_114298/g.272040 Transcript_114298/m.272040 type:complete len:81 (+) Transcript_114298:108-350(+)|eukprot:CAMPEP_0181455598 /NCGR_PEP_ID=MMETSP1110-20121109/30840_1 /TAXON_ID=174948 /ORGANISM="Symbiodinium sp., Strain CCMP421" /LENGTH=80 /DNA_ID=CAMNT_0023579987 /DNA_START=79 /DNA_END=321 /DNA_ORIENTATION=+